MKILYQKPIYSQENLDKAVAYAIEVERKAKSESFNAMYEALKEATNYLRFNKGNAAPIYDKGMEALALAEGKG